MEYFIINLILSLWALATTLLLKTSPFRIRFRITTVALCAWLIPFPWLNDLIISKQTLEITHPLSSISNSIQNALLPLKVNTDIGIKWFWIFTILSVFGLIKFVLDLVSFKETINHHVCHSSFYKKESGVHYFSVKGLNGAHTNGIFHPIVWFDEKFKNTPQLQSLLQHEKAHIEQNDPLYLILISCIQRVFWWNPLVYILSKRARQYIELSCDEAVSNKMGSIQYEQDLAEIMMSQNKHSSNILMNNILSKSSFNIYRIKQLTKEFNMNKINKYKLSLSTLLLLLILSTLIFSMQSQSHNSQGTTKSNEEYEITENQIVLVMDAHLYNYSDPNNKEKGYKHASYGVNVIVDLGKTFELDSDQLGGFNITVLPLETKDGAIFLDMNVSLPLGLDIVDSNPNLMLKRKQTGSFSMTDDAGKYKFETYLTIRK